jgi:hypothetical protein
MSDEDLGPVDGEAPPEETRQQKKRRKRSTILVSIDGWPNQEPGRLMVWGWKPSPQKAARAVKKLREHFGPEVRWSIEPMTSTEARTVRLRPFNLREWRHRQGLVELDAEA